MKILGLKAIETYKLRCYNNWNILKDVYVDEHHIAVLVGRLSGRVSTLIQDWYEDESNKEINKHSGRLGLVIRTKDKSIKDHMSKGSTYVLFDHYQGLKVTLFTEDHHIDPNRIIMYIIKKNDVKATVCWKNYWLKLTDEQNLYTLCYDDSYLDVL